MTARNLVKVSDAITAFFSQKGIDTAFIVTGGGAMHLNDSLYGHSEIRCFYFHHEQAAAMAAEGYARVAGKPCILNVTSGPGTLNALTGVFGAFADSVPIIVLSGQVKTETLLDLHGIKGLRQLGDQEVQTAQIVKNLTKWYGQLQECSDIANVLETAWKQAVSGRPGPCWLDIPIDIQGMKVDIDKVTHGTQIPAKPDIKDYSGQIDDLFTALDKAKRPVIFAGTGVRISNTMEELKTLSEHLKIPVTTAWTHDIFDNLHPMFAGRTGTIGTRAGNFVVQSADLVIILGSRLNIRQISYNFDSFARNAYKIWIDIDPAELNKPFPKVDEKMEADLADFMPQLIQRCQSSNINIKWLKWLEWVRHINQKYSPKANDYPTSNYRINAYHLIAELFNLIGKDDILVCGNATATIVPYQIGRLTGDQRLISNSGCASMGYDLPAAIGAAIASPERRIICLAGDGSIMMNLQDLITITAYKLNIVVIILENDGYLSIKQTQRNFFGRESGSSSESGLCFPDFGDIAKACGLHYTKLTADGYKQQLPALLSKDKAMVIEAPLDLQQEFEPRLKSKMQGDKIVTPELDDMFPFLDEAELTSVRQSALMK